MPSNSAAVGTERVKQSGQTVPVLVFQHTHASSETSGLSISAKGVLELDSTKLDTALQSNFEGVVTLLTGNQENLSVYSQAPGGVANSAIKKLTTMLDVNSAITAQSTNLTKKISTYKYELEKLEFRMTDLLARYNKQFGAMESMVGQSKVLKSGLTSTFDGMMAAYTK